MLNQWLNYHHLYYFMTIAELNSISKAAEKLLVGQPTLSAQLKIFEENLGVKLFERNHNKLILTEHGKLALEYARGIFKMGSEMYDALHDRIRPAKLSIQLGALDSIPKQVMLKISQKCLNISPCSISLIEGKFEELMRELTSHRIDLIISNFIPQLESTKGVFHKTISKSSIAIYGNSKFESLKKNFPRSLKNQPFVLPTYDSQMRYDLEHWLQTNEISIDVVAETQDIALKKLMATEGLAMIPAASYAVKKQLDANELILIGEINNISEELFLISAQRKMTNPVAAELMKNFTV